jgi:hypothetical protein
MLIGKQLLADHTISLQEVSHRNFKQLLETFEAKQMEYHQQAIQDLRDALNYCYGKRDVSLQQLSATFRRGDLLELLEILKLI